MKTNKVLIVLGMHRSGTSLMARWLHACGLNIGDMLHGPDIGNEDGHFEDIDFLHLHEAILEAQDCSTDGMLDKPISALDDHDFRLLSELVSKKSKLHREWGWKDPRTCLFLEQYRKIITDAKYIVLVRDYNEVVSSLVMRQFKVWEIAHFSRFPQNMLFIRSIYPKLWQKFKYRKNRAAFFAKYSESYLRTWVCYNEQLLLHIKAIQPDVYLLFDTITFKQASKKIFGVLKHDWGFDLQDAGFESVYKPAFLGHHLPVKQYIKDPTLVERAELIQEELQQLINVQNN